MDVALIHGYGIYSSENFKYKRYLEKIIDFLNTSAIDLVVVSGGFTDKTQPNVSEAQSIINQLKPKFDKITFVAEELAFTTPQNLEFTAKIYSIQKK